MLQVNDTIANNGNLTTSEGCPFFDKLLAEILVDIYELIFMFTSKSVAVNDSCCYVDTLPSRAVLQTCRKAYNEARSIYKDVASRELRAVVQRYGEVADAVNGREMQRFIDEVTSKWHVGPEIPGGEPRLDGWTQAGVFNLNIYRLAFYNDDPPQPTDRPLCLAERHNQVLLQPPAESWVDLIPKPLADPLPSDQRTVKLKALEAALRQQAEASGSTQQQIHLPQDFAFLMASTDGLQGAGVPRETCHIQLIYSLEFQKVKRVLSPHLAYWMRYGDRDRTPVAAWQIGGCEQHRNIYYVLCQSADAVSSWRVFDYDGDVEIESHDDLTSFIQCETERVDKTPGGAAIEDLLNYDRYPVY